MSFGRSVVPQQEEHGGLISRHDGFEHQFWEVGVANRVCDLFVDDDVDGGFCQAKEGQAHGFFGNDDELAEGVDVGEGRVFGFAHVSAFDETNDVDGAVIVVHGTGIRIGDTRGEDFEVVDAGARKRLDQPCAHEVDVREKRVHNGRLVDFFEVVVENFVNLHSIL